MSAPPSARAANLGLFTLSGQGVLLTGATGGLGFAMAQAMAAQGATLGISDRDAAACETLARELRHNGAVCSPLVSDGG